MIKVSAPAKVQHGSASSGMKVKATEGTESTALFPGAERLTVMEDAEASESSSRNAAANWNFTMPTVLNNRI